MAHSSSASADRLREQGNSSFHLSSSPSLSPSVRISRLQSARSFYLQALHASSSPSQQAACSKNLGAVHFRLATLPSSDLRPPDLAPDGSASALGLYPLLYLSRSASYFCEALDHGRLASKSLEWMVNIDGTLTQIANIVAQDAMIAADAQTSRDTLIRSVPFETLVDLGATFSVVARQNGHYAANASAIAHTGQAECFLKLVFKVLSNRDRLSTLNSGECLKDLQKCHSLVQIAEDLRSANDGYIQELRSRIVSAQRICQSIQAVRTADEFIKQSNEAITDRSKVMDFAFAAIDKYKEAEIAARDSDLQTRAVALSGIGRVYEEMLRIPEQAKAYYRRALEILVPEAEFTDAVLHARIKAALQRLEMKGARQRESEGNKRKETLKEQLQGALREIRRKCKELDALAFLKYIYGKHPPMKGSEDVAKMIEGAAPARSAIRKAISHYHPDHTSFSVDEKDAIVNEEITKCLLERYSSFRYCKPQAAPN